MRRDCDLTAALAGACICPACRLARSDHESPMDVGPSRLVGRVRGWGWGARPSYTDLQCPACGAPVGRGCVDRRGVARVNTCGARIRAVDNEFLVAAGYEPLRGEVSE